MPLGTSRGEANLKNTTAPIVACSKAAANAPKTHFCSSFREARDPASPAFSNIPLAPASSMLAVLAPWPYACQVWSGRCGSTLSPRARVCIQYMYCTCRQVGYTTPLYAPWPYNCRSLASWDAYESACTSSALYSSSSSSSSSSRLESPQAPPSSRSRLLGGSSGLESFPRVVWGI